MTKLVDALRQKNTRTENGMVTNSSSLNACVDLFFNIGAMRGQDKNRLISNFSSALVEDPLRAMRILFWARDVRGGAGERQIFRDVIQYLANGYKEFLSPNLSYIPEFGRWDDLLTLIGTPLEDEAFYLISKAIEDKNGLCAKWMPRKGKEAEKLRAYMKMTPKQYRKTLVNLTQVVESKMCSNQWEEIEYGKIPSLASARYQKAFGKHDPTGYTAYKQGLAAGTEKINAGAVYPYDVIKSVHRGDSAVAMEQWKALPNYMEDSENERILPVVDVSGSMSSAAGNNPNLTCMDVAVSLGLYISERNEGTFKDAFITFSANPQLQYLKGDLKQRLNQMRSSDWGMNTNLQATFDLILSQAKMHSVPESEMPTKILILSDMEFDAAVSNHTSLWGRSSSVPTFDPTAQEMIRKQYEEAGYKMPAIVYWNIQSRNGNVPVRFDESGTALISGFSPSIMKSILGGDIESPVQIMDKTIMDNRYETITV